MIDNRIKTMANFVQGGGVVADIGADHGFLAIELVKSGRAAKVIATEKNIHPFAALSNNISGFNRIEARLGDGLQVLSAGEVDTICIAGMGGALIQKILDDSPEVVQGAHQLILQPMNAVNKIRSWLALNNWAVADEDLAEAGGIIYEIICAERNPLQKTFKRNTSPLKQKFLAKRAEKLEKVLAEMKKSSEAQKSQKFLALQAEIDALRHYSRHSNSNPPM